MRKFLATTCAVALCGSAAVMTLPASASASTPSVVARAGVNSASVTGARTIAKAVVAFRADMNAVLASYVTDYGNRLSESELANAKGLIVQADASLNGVQAATARTSALASSGASKMQVLAASRAAEKAFTKSHDQALASLNQITPILQPKLGLFEALGARRDADARLSKFSELGVKISALTKTINSSR
jgi:hypothetical protein